jgi:hypothetical protein
MNHPLVCQVCGETLCKDKDHAKEARIRGIMARDIGDPGWREAVYPPHMAPPSPEEIRERCAAVREGWSDARWAEECPPSPPHVPVYATSPGYDPESMAEFVEFTVVE